MYGFIHEGKTYIQVKPVKKLFQSNLIHDVITRGDIFAVNIQTQELTIISGKSDVVHIRIDQLTALIQQEQMKLDV